MKKCPCCGEEVEIEDVECKHCGKSFVLPENYRRFNWGAFLLTWIWGIGNKSYISFLLFAFGLFNIIPFIGWLVPLGFHIWLGVKGNELAWKNQNWKSFEEFDKTQRKWAMWGLIIFIFLTLPALLLMLIAMAAKY